MPHVKSQPCLFFMYIYVFGMGVCPCQLCQVTSTFYLSLEPVLSFRFLQPAHWWCAWPMLHHLQEPGRDRQAPMMHHSMCCRVHQSLLEYMRWVPQEVESYWICHYCLDRNSIKCRNVFPEKKVLKKWWCSIKSLCPVILSMYLYPYVKCNGGHRRSKKDWICNQWNSQNFPLKQIDSVSIRFDQTESVSQGRI